MIKNSVTIPMAAYVAVGMSALFVAVVGAPLTGIALVVEMTGATALFVPLLTACASALAVTAALGVRPFTTHCVIAIRQGPDANLYITKTQPIIR